MSGASARNNDRAGTLAWRRAGVAALALLLVADVIRGADRRVPAGVGPLVLYPGERNADDGDWHGLLVLDGKCLYSTWDSDADDDDDWDARVLLAFPRNGTAWDPGSQTVRFDHHRYHVGERVSLGGSVAGASFANWATPPDSSCDASHVFLVG